MNKQLRNQLIALPLAVLTCALLVGFLFLEITLLNHFTTDNISLHIGLGAVLVGVTIYLKTSVDFALVIGRLMEKNPGLKGRIGIEVGTAAGNAAGTLGILLIWTFFKEVPWLLAIMIVVAALVLIRLAQDGLHYDSITSFPRVLRPAIKRFEQALNTVNKLLDPLLSRIVPSRSIKISTRATMWGLLVVAFTIPFVLGLDNFAGYVPLFNIINVFSFGIGVFVGHMLLNIFLYISPKHTVAIVKNPVVALLGSLVFIVLALFGFIEAFRLLF